MVTHRVIFIYPWMHLQKSNSRPKDTTVLARSWHRQASTIVHTKFKVYTNLEVRLFFALSSCHKGEIDEMKKYGFFPYTLR